MGYVLKELGEEEIVVTVAGVSRPASKMGSGRQWRSDGRVSRLPIHERAMGERSGNGEGLWWQRRSRVVG